jgi:hypothetical protein
MQNQIAVEDAGALPVIAVTVPKNRAGAASDTHRWQFPDR